MQRMEAKIEEMAALADARHELRQEFSGDQLEQRIQELGGGDGDVDAELLELKQRLQIEHK
jgi:phage shock protein A